MTRACDFYNIFVVYKVESNLRQKFSVIQTDLKMGLKSIKQSAKYTEFSKIKIKIFLGVSHNSDAYGD